MTYAPAAELGLATGHFPASFFASDDHASGAFVFLRLLPHLSSHDMAQPAARGVRQDESTVTC